MEKFKTVWKFTDEEKDSFRLSLKKTGTNQEKTEQFISHLESICDEIKSCLNSPKRDKVRSDREEALKAFKKAMSVVEDILSMEKCLTDFTGMLDIGDLSPYDKKNPQPYRDEVSSFMTHLRFADAMRKPLQNMIALLEKDLSRKRPVGRGGADERNFIRNIAEIYRRHIGKPTSYPYGPFYAVVSVAFEAVGLPSKDPIRGIRIALKT